MEAMTLRQLLQAVGGTLLGDVSDLNMEFADARNQTVHSGNSFVVVIHLHIEGFDFLRIVGYEYRTFEDLFGQVTLVLGLQVAAPGYLVFEFVVVLFQKFNGLCISYMCKIGICHMVQAFQQSLVHEGVEEIHFFRSVLQNVIDHVFQHRLGKIHIVLQVCESHLRLDHPEFSRMAGGVGVFRAEGRTKGVNVAECLGEGFAVELAADGQACFFVEEILCEIHGTILVFRNILKIQSGYLEHFAGAFAVTSGDQRSIDIYESSLLEKLMNRISAQGTYTEYRLEGIGARTQMRDCAQEFHGVAFFLQWVIRSGSAFQGDFLCLDLKRLLCVRCRYQRTFDNDGGAYVQLGDFVKVCHFIMVYDLKRFKVTSVVEDDKTKGF